MDWNVIVSVNQYGYMAVRDFLHDYGKVKSTDFFNVLVMRVEDIEQFLDDMESAFSTADPVMKHIGHIMPVTDSFIYQSPEEFEQQAKEIVTHWLDKLAGQHFYVRMHRRGFKGRLSSIDEERFLDEFILDSLEQQGKPPAKLDFEDPDTVIALETVGQEAGLSLWSREQLVRYPFLKLK
jgi:tRNA(Ser,Leu) C12 N-acetylase TAN1